MAKIAHLSDIHFGRHDPAIVAAVEAFLAERQPDLVVISGDLTQRARVSQYQLACEFIDRIEGRGLEVLAVPGNHDVPLYDIVRRFTRPLNRFLRYIDDDLCPYWENEELAVLGINTARSFTFKDGSVSHEQMDRIRRTFGEDRGDKLRVLVTHHPLLGLPFGEEGEPTETARRSTDALLAAADAGVDLLLAGHFHRSFSKSARELVDNVGPALVVQAGTTASMRLRGGEQQSFNWIEAGKDGIAIEVHAWQEGAFQHGKPARFAFDGVTWHSVVEAQA